MASPFADNPCKQTVRTAWNTPLLRHLHSLWGRKYFYFGLPGPEALDIKLWASMIEQVVAFEIETDDADNPRRDLVQLQKTLALLKGVRSTVYCGPLEDVVLLSRDYDGKPLNLADFVTLFNLDFCNAITGKVATRTGRRCIRFEAIREIVAIQRRLYRSTGSDRFIVLLTVRDEMHADHVHQMVADKGVAKEVVDHCKRIMRSGAVPRTGMFQNRELLKAFVFCRVRDYLRGQNISSVFLPAVAYQGASRSSPMLHFVVICKMAEQGTAQPGDVQSLSDLLTIGAYEATASGLVRPGTRLGETPPDPIHHLRRYAATLG